MSLTVARIADRAFQPALTEGGRYLLGFRYLAPGPDGTFEEPVQLFRRVACNVAEAERRFRPGISDGEVGKHAEAFFSLMTDFRFLPNAPTLLGAGRPLQQLFACFVLPVGDSVAEVFDALRSAALVHSHGGGTGFSFSRLRPRGAPIGKGGVSTGAVSFLRVFDAETEVIKAGGTGWGANMAVLRCDHPDVSEFIRVKSGGALRNFNVSVGASDAFMEATRHGRDWALVDPSTAQVVGQVSAAELLAEVSRQAWATGDPGFLFLDRINADNPTPALGDIEATNPCGEAPLLPFEACCLGGLNVARFVDAGGRIEWAGLRESAELALRMMDDVIEVSRFPLPEIERAVRQTRKVGIGVMGFADLLIRLGIPYDSPESLALARELMRTIQEATHAASERLAYERGSFPAFPGSRWERRGYRRLRNATTTSNAPNSTIGVIAGCSPGIEPLFALAYERHLVNGHRLRELHPGFVEIATRRALASDAFFARVREAGSLRELADVPPDLRRVFVTAHEIAPSWHVRVQSAFQQHTDLGVSKTINLPHSATPADVEAVFLLAHELGCKGITCYRDRCQDTQFLVAGTTADGALACADCD